MTLTLDDAPAPLAPAIDFDKLMSEDAGPMSEPIHISLDIETLATSKRALVTSIAAVVFNEFGTHATWQASLRIQPQIDAGRAISEGTLKFWAGQPPEIFAKSLAGEMHVAEAIASLEAWLISVGSQDQSNGNVWVKGPAFDGAIIEDLCENFSLKCPIGYREWRDVRTIERLAGYKAPPIGAGAHDPLIDAVAQAESVITCYHKLGLSF